MGEEEDRIEEWRVVRCVDKSKRDFSLREPTVSQERNGKRKVGSLRSK